MRWKYKKQNTTKELLIITAILILLFMGIIKTTIYAIDNGMKNCVMDNVGCTEEVKKLDLFENNLPQSQDKDSYIIKATITAYNTVPEQTDNTPCISASGHNICGRSDVVACPIYLPFGTLVSIAGKQYFCLDRMAGRFRNERYFDISFDKDVYGAKKWGRKEIDVIVYY